MRWDTYAFTYSLSRELKALASLFVCLGALISNGFQTLDGLQDKTMAHGNA